MAATYCTKAELRSALGIQSLYSDSVVEEVCQAAENIIKSKLWFNNQAITGTALSSNVATIYTYATPLFRIGQQVTLTNCGSTFNGTFTITAQDDVSFSFAKTASDQIIFLVRPYGTATGTTTGVDYATQPEVREATLMIAVDIWQARQLSSTGGISPDFQPSPYRMGNSLLSRVRGLIADHLAPTGMVG